jgi:hypothetical protein
MRQYILSPQEREVIKEYLATGKKLDGFKVILHRAKNMKTEAVNADLDLIKQFLAKVEGAKT